MFLLVLVFWLVVVYLCQWCDYGWCGYVCVCGCEYDCVFGCLFGYGGVGYVYVGGCDWLCGLV